MSDPSFRVVEPREVVPEPNQRSLVRTTRTQPTGVLQRNILASGTILILGSAFTAVAAAVLDNEAYGYGNPFANPGYIPAVFAYMLNASTNPRASSLTPLPFYDINGGTGAVGTEYIPRVIDEGGATLRVQIHVRSTDADIDRLFYYFILDGPPDGLVST